MDDPILVEVTRGQVVESRHRGAIAVVDGDGRLIAGLGDIDRPVFPRSAVKAIQALPLVESGAAADFGFGPEELALAISSHNGEAAHVATARRMLAAAGLDETCLECGPQWPERGPDQAVMHRMGARAARIHNNCSGKHAGFLCTAAATKVDPRGYVKPDHPVMRAVVAALEALTGAPHRQELSGIDGCSIPTYAIPLQAIARGFGRFMTGAGQPALRRLAAAELMAAAATVPFNVAGSGRFDTVAMAALGKRAFIKTGAEGVFIVALPKRGVAVAVKAEDGASRASEAITARLIIGLLGLEAGQPGHDALAALAAPAILSRTGQPCGTVRAAPALAAFADGLRRA